MGDIDNDIEGLYSMSAKKIFNYLEMSEHDHLMVGVSFYEIYCEKAYDLLNYRAGCPIRVDGKDNVNVVGLNEKIISNYESLVALISTGLRERITSSTGMNKTSSRSHAILSIILRDSQT